MQGSSLVRKGPPRGHLCATGDRAVPDTPQTSITPHGRAETCHLRAVQGEDTGAVPVPSHTAEQGQGQAGQHTRPLVPLPATMSFLCCQ